MNTGRMLMVLGTSILLMSAVGVLFNVYRVPTILYYLVIPLMTFGIGYAVAWAYGTTNQDVALVVAAACGLIGVQGAWVLTTRIPRT